MFFWFTLEVGGSVVPTYNSQTRIGIRERIIFIPSEPQNEVHGKKTQYQIISQKSFLYQ